MNLFLSVVLTLGIQQPVLIPGCCPVVNVLVWRVVPVLVRAPPVAPVVGPAPNHDPREMGAVPHVARI